MKITQKLLLHFALILFSAVLIGCSGGDSNNTQAPVNVKLIAFNDFHGYLVQDDPDNEVDVYDSDTNSSKSVSVGGGAFMATLINQLRAQNDNNIVVAAGDLIGASPAVSSLTADEATIDFMNLIGLEVSAVGNHEFDRQKEELLRLQNGGCSTNPKYAAQTCLRNGTFAGANFKYLAANVTYPNTNETLFSPTFTKKFGTVSIGFIGLTLENTPAATRGAGNLNFAKEVTTINAQADVLKSQGVDAVVVLLHQGGSPDTDYINQQQTCSDLSGSIKDIVTNIKNVDVVVSGHTHKEYICNNVAGTNILLTQASLYGNIVSNIDLTIVPGKGVTAKTAQNLPVINNLNTSLPKGYAALEQDKAAADLINDYAVKTQAKRTETKGYTVKELVRVDSGGSRVNIAEHPIGYVVADAFLLAAISPPSDSGRTSVGTADNTIAFINPGGLRNSINKVGAVTFDDLFSVAPFSNNLYVAELTGAQVLRLLEQQWEDKNCDMNRAYQGICGRIMQPSSNFKYDWDIDQPRDKPTGDGAVVVASTILINGASLDLTKTYKIVTVDFLAVDGGDNYTVFKDATVRANLEVFDLDAIFEYFSLTSSTNQLTHPAKGRINCINTASSPAISCSVIPVSCNWPGQTQPCQ